MSCGCGCNCSGLGALPTAQVAALNDYVVAGSVIEWGGKIYWPDSDELIGWHSDGEGRVKNALWAHGGFSMVNAGNIDSAWSPYISIAVTTRVDFAHLDDVLTTIEGAIWQAGYRPDSQNFWVKSVPASAVNRSGVAQPNAGAGNPPPNAPNAFDLCKTFPVLCPDPNAPDKNAIDKLAEWLGIGQTEALLVGVAGTLAGIVILKRLL